MKLIQLWHCWRQCHHEWDYPGRLRLMHITRYLTVRHRCSKQRVWRLANG